MKLNVKQIDLVREYARVVFSVPVIDGRISNFEVHASEGELVSGYLEYFWGDHTAGGYIIFKSDACDKRTFKYSNDKTGFDLQGYNLDVFLEFKRTPDMPFQAPVIEMTYSLMPCRDATIPT